MRFLRLTAFLAAVLGTVSVAWAQYGLYGSPEMLRLPPPNAAANVQPAYPAAPAGYEAPPSSFSMPSEPNPEPAPINYAPPAGPYPSYQTQNPYPAYQRPAYRAADTRSAVPAPPGMAPGAMSGPRAPGMAPSQPLRPIPTTPPQGMSNPGPNPGMPTLSQSPNVTNQMLDEYGNGGSPYAGCGPGGGCGGNGCGDLCGTGCQPLWYGWAAGLIMTRDNSNRVWTSSRADLPQTNVLNTQEADANEWRGGYEVRLGRRFCGGLWAVEATYWSIDGMDGFATRSQAGNGYLLNTPLTTQFVRFTSDTDLVSNYFNGANTQTLWRQNSFQDIELSLLRNQLTGFGCDPCSACSPLNVSWSIGARYFQFREDLRFGSRLGSSWDEQGGIYSAYFRENLRNELYGVQVGCDAALELGFNLRVYASPKIGLYDNHITGLSDLYRGDGVRASAIATSSQQGSYSVDNSKDSLAFLGQVDVGVNWQFHPSWAAFVGYRLIAATGIGLADNQIPVDWVNFPAMREVNTNGELLLHGGFAGVTCNF